MLCDVIDCTVTDMCWMNGPMPTLIGMDDPTLMPSGGEKVTLKGPAE